MAALQSPLAVADEADGVLLQPALGAALRRMRTGRRLTLAEVSRAAGLSPSFLSLVENGRSDIAIGRVVGLLRVYGATMAELLADQGRDSGLVVRRGSERRLQSGIGVEWLALAPSGRRMTPLLAILKPHARAVVPGHGLADLFVYVCTGTLLLEAEGDPAVLHVGDSAYTTAPGPATLTNLTDGTTTAIIVIAPREELGGAEHPLLASGPDAPSLAEADLAGPDGAVSQPALGLQLRRIRLARELSLRKLSEATGISVASISALENGRRDISIGRLMRLLEACEARLSDLWHAGARVSAVVRSGEGRLLRSPDGRIETRMLASVPCALMMPIVSTYEPHARRTGIPAHRGETVAHVLEGSFLFELADIGRVVLHAGDTLCFRRPDPGPQITNVSDCEGRLLSAISPPRL